MRAKRPTARAASPCAWAYNYQPLTSLRQYQISYGNRVAATGIAVYTNITIPYDDVFSSVCITFTAESYQWNLTNGILPMDTRLATPSAIRLLHIMYPGKIWIFGGYPGMGYCGILSTILVFLHKIFSSNTQQSHSKQYFPSKHSAFSQYSVLNIPTVWSIFTRNTQYSHSIATFFLGIPSIF